MDDWQDKTDWKDLWLLTPEQAPLLSGMTDKRHLGFAIQLKFMEIYGPFPSSGMDVIQYFAQLIDLSGDLFSSYEPLDWQALHHRQTFRKLLGDRLSAHSDLRQLFDGLCAEVYPWLHKYNTPVTHLLTGFASNVQSLLQPHILIALFVRQHTILKRRFYTPFTTDSPITLNF